MLVDKNKDAEIIDSTIATYGWKDDDRPLPFVQLGDVFVKDDKSYVFAVINASCDLQIVPANVRKKGRTRNRDDTVLLLPGEVCKLGTTAPKALTTELFTISKKYYAIEWKPKQLIAIPQCCLRMKLQDRGYLHKSRLQMDRAIELQQEAFALNSRIGLEVQPQLSRSVELRISVKIAGKIKTLGDDIDPAGGVFHTRSKTVLVFNHDCLVEIKRRLEANAHADFKIGKQQFDAVYPALHKCPFEVNRTLKVIKPNNVTDSCKKIRIEFSSDATTADKELDVHIYFHFFDQQKSNAN